MNYHIRNDHPDPHHLPSLADLAARYRAVRAHTETLCAGLSGEDQCVQSMPDASPAKWHRAHSTWFFEQFVLRDALARYRPFDPAFGFLFNSYYEQVGARHPRPSRGLLTRPDAATIGAYRAHVDTAMGRLLETADAITPALADLVVLGLQHEQQHQELLLTDILHAFAQNPLQPAALPGWVAPSAIDGAGFGSTNWTEFPGGLVEIGHSAAGFAFDNETPAHTVFLAPFRLARGLVRNQDWQDFIADGGYRRPEFWMSDGWACAQAKGWQAPLYWQAEDRVFTLGGPQPRDPQAPVCHISWYEADAYARWAGARWAGARLPTEAEWESAANAQPGLLAGLVGQVWQWTNSAYLPYPGFAPAAGAVGEYNGKFMINQMVLRGGSLATPPGHARPTYRNFFPPDRRWQFSGLRLAR